MKFSNYKILLIAFASIGGILLGNWRTDGALFSNPIVAGGFLIMYALVIFLIIKINAKNKKK